MNEYGEGKIAEDSDDEKRIAKAVATSERKAAQLKKKSHSGRGAIIRAGQLMYHLGSRHGCLGPCQWHGCLILDRYASKAQTLLPLLLGFFINNQCLILLLSVASHEQHI